MPQDANIVEIKKQIHDNNLKRYVLSVVSGQEQIVIENMKERIQKQGLSEDVVDYMSPVVNEYSLKKGEKVIKQKKLYPGYVFIKSKMNDKIWYIIRNTPGVRLIVGAETRPVPLTEKEYQDIVDHIAKSQERAELQIPYKEGDVVMLKTGDFKGMKGNIKTIDTEKGTVIVNIEMLGRLTPVVIDADKIELMN
ncbi:MAG TPA: transcription termination/antitermination protein NusG [Candidatus Absconditabacterales bacterium]|nr:transcription termination/antitermination protein NusG [Candidatus Absconditabacterales bacterium]